MATARHRLFAHRTRLLLTLFSGWVAPTGQAQLLSVDNVSISLTTGTEVTVEGAVLLTSAATFRNQGDLRVAGNWTNNTGGTGFATSSAGRVRLYGGVQTIGGTSVTDFRRLILTGGTKQLLRDAVVGVPGVPDGTLELGALLSLEGRTFTVFNPAGNAVTHSGGWVLSGSLTSRFQWSLGADLTEHRVLFGEPAGPAIPFAYTPAAPAPVGTVLSAATYRSDAANLPYPITAGQQVTHMAGATVLDNSPNTADRFWLVDLPNGPFTGSLLLSYAPTEDPALGPGAIRAQRWSESGGTWQFPPLPGQSNPAIREVLVPNVLFSEAIAPLNEHIWALAYDYAPLPVELLHFTALPTDAGTVNCAWTTASEQDNAYFTVERSGDALAFQAIGQVEGAGTSHVPLDYRFEDPDPLPGLSYYRLRQTDFDGTSTLSQVVPVWFDAPGPRVTVCPNPNAGTFTLLRSAADAALPLELRDASGRLVRQWQMPQGQEREQVTVDGAPGLYTLRWAGGQARVSVLR